jgi:hypothetical protein
MALLPLLDTPAAYRAIQPDGFTWLPVLAACSSCTVPLGAPGCRRARRPRTIRRPTAGADADGACARLARGLTVRLLPQHKTTGGTITLPLRQDLRGRARRRQNSAALCRLVQLQQELAASRNTGYCRQGSCAALMLSMSSTFALPRVLRRPVWSSPQISSSTSPPPPGAEDASSDTTLPRSRYGCPG